MVGWLENMYDTGPQGLSLDSPGLYNAGLSNVLKKNNTIPTHAHYHLFLNGKYKIAHLPK